METETDLLGDEPALAPAFTLGYFRHPDLPGDSIHAACQYTWHDHGWIDDGSLGITVCPSRIGPFPGQTTAYEGARLRAGLTYLIRKWRHFAATIPCDGIEISAANAAAARANAAVWSYAAPDVRGLLGMRPPCPLDTNGDGDCGAPLCPHCGTQARPPSRP